MSIFVQNCNRMAEHNEFGKEGETAAAELPYRKRLLHPSS